MVNTLRTVLPRNTCPISAGALEVLIACKRSIPALAPFQCPFQLVPGTSPAGISKSEITSWNLPYLLIIALLFMHIIIILGMHSIIIVFLIKVSSRNAIRNTIWEVRLLLLCLSIYLYIYLCIYLSNLSVYISIYLICMSICLYLSICLSIYLVFYQLLPSCGNQAPFVSVSPLVWSESGACPGDG